VEINFQRFQSAYLLIGKFIAFVRIAIPYLAGINKVTYGKFNLYNLLAAMAWSALFLVMGRYLEMIWRHYGQALIIHWYITAPILMIVIVILWWVHKTVQNRLEKK
jgi:membrane protein DedA with SNARE-associated domain